MKLGQLGHNIHREAQKQCPYLPLTFSACQWGYGNSCPGWCPFLSAGGRDQANRFWTTDPMKFRTASKQPFLMQSLPSTNRLPHYSINEDWTHMMKPHNEHTVELNWKIIEQESLANEHTQTYSLEENRNNKDIIVIIVVQPCFTCFNVTNVSTQNC